MVADIAFDIAWIVDPTFSVRVSSIFYRDAGLIRLFNQAVKDQSIILCNEHDSACEKPKQAY